MENINFVNFYFFSIMQVISLFIKPSIEVACCYLTMIIIGSFLNFIIACSRENVNSWKIFVIFEDFSLVIGPYMMYHIIVLSISLFLPLSILSFVPYFIQLEMSDDYFIKFYKILLRITCVVSIAFLIGLYVWSFYDFVNPVMDFIRKYNVYQYLPANIE